MRAISIIFKRELGAYLASPIGWIIISVYLLLSGVLFQAWAMGSVPLLSAEVLDRYFFVASGITMVAGIVISFRLIAEERQNQTAVLLNTSPVRDHEIIIGKYAAALAFLTLMLVLSLYIPMLIKVRGKIAAAEVAVGYLGLFLLGASALAIGIFASATTRHQIVSLVVGLSLLTLMILLWWMAKITEPPLAAVFKNIGIFHTHFGSGFQKGILELKDVVYYLALTYFFLLLATKTLEAKRWQ